MVFKTLRLVAILAAALIAPYCRAEAQQSGDVHRIGYVQIAPPQVQLHLTEVFERGLRESGYTAGRDILIEYRFAGRRVDRLPALVADLVRLNLE
jgi:putative tryptophan/tyrosine transport system substrate-binding protein